ncbi:MAG: ribonuclease HI, partial [Tepidisphaerales bacterium]
WGLILKHPSTGHGKEGSGGEHHTTNNRMEIMAVIRGLEALKKPCQVRLVSDSQYVINAISAWMPRWKKFGWRKSRKSRVYIRNVDLWRRLDELLAAHQVDTHWVKGHAGHRENERCDVLAQSTAEAVARTPAPPKPPPVDLRVPAGELPLFASLEPVDEDADDDAPAEATAG